MWVWAASTLVAAACSRGPAPADDASAPPAAAATEAEAAPGLILERADDYLEKWSRAQGEDDPGKLVDIALNANFVHKNYPQTVRTDWFESVAASSRKFLGTSDSAAAYLGRLIDSDLPPPSPTGPIDSDVDAAVYAATWCDDDEVLERIVAAGPRVDLARLVSQSGYEATHAIASIGLLEENGCSEAVETGGPWPAPETQWNALEALILERPIDDLMLEACGVAQYRGFTGASPAARSRLAEIHAAQFEDGSFGRKEGADPGPHATIWAIRCLAPLVAGDPAPGENQTTPTWIGP